MTMRSSLVSAQILGDELNALRVTGSERILGVDRAGQTANGLGEHVADLDDLLVPRPRRDERHRERNHADRPRDHVHRRHQPRNWHQPAQAESELPDIRQQNGMPGLVLSDSDCASGQRIVQGVMDAPRC
jgi:hypothetical protein